jgi:hypothetical protein
MFDASTASGQATAMPVRRLPHGHGLPEQVHVTASAIDAGGPDEPAISPQEVADAILEQLDLGQDRAG